jgi:hypothetical protein
VVALVEEEIPSVSPELLKNLTDWERKIYLMILDAKKKKEKNKRI